MYAQYQQIKSSEEQVDYPEDSLLAHHIRRENIQQTYLFTSSHTFLPQKLK